MKTGLKVNVLLASLLICSLGITSTAIADSKGNSGKGKLSASSSVKSAWVNPAATSKKPTLVQAGRTVPTKFRLIVNNVALTSTNMVQVSLNSLNSCDAGAQVQNSVVLVSAAPAPAVSASASASASTSASASASSSASNSESESKASLTSVNGVFRFNWKVPKSQAIGCYTLTAIKDGISVTSPILRVKGTK